MDDRPLLSANDPEQLDRFRQAVKEQKARKAEAEPVDVGAPAVWDDRSCKGYCPSLDVQLEGRSHLKRLMKARGVEHAQ